MEIIQSQESFKRVNGKYQFSYIRGFVRHGNALFVAKWYNRREAPRSMSDLSEAREVNLNDRGPVLRPHWVVAPADPHDYYIKTPSLRAYADEDVETLLGREIDICETLKRNPHRHIAFYYGCREVRGRAIGLCFKRYVSTLADRVDPEHLSKAAFVVSSRPNADDRLREGLEGIKQAISHLHALGIVHNDITPANIMLEEDDTMVLIDFDSSRPVGAKFGGPDGERVKRTRGWHDPEVSTALRENDTNAYNEIEAWLFGESTECFMFE
ncbi:protein kinase domain-containing protein [Purpureocillium lilacinum]|uniref:EKC/KEOPS complex subunit BUD32 n=1 Tax=Purpureocillium lilacinum TaxID=33203 RepID=A0A179GA79_PURLI|nr:protein kinase domain-containing protein [Purpureocillium lilacinum]